MVVVMVMGVGVAMGMAFRMAVGPVLVSIVRSVRMAVRAARSGRVVVVGRHTETLGGGSQKANRLKKRY